MYNSRRSPPLLPWLLDDVNNIINRFLLVILKVSSLFRRNLLFFPSYFAFLENRVQFGFSEKVPFCCEDRWLVGLCATWMWLSRTIWSQ